MYDIIFKLLRDNSMTNEYYIILHNLQLIRIEYSQWRLVLIIVIITTA